MLWGHVICGVVVSDVVGACEMFWVVSDVVVVRKMLLGCVRSCWCV